MKPSRPSKVERREVLTGFWPASGRGEKRMKTCKDCGEEADVKRGKVFLCLDCFDRREEYSTARCEQYEEDTGALSLRSTNLEGVKKQ